MARTSLWQRTIVFAVCITLFISLLPVRAKADDRKDILEKVQITIGQPSIWSLGQAHYFIAQMHKKNRGLKAKFPEESDLDPNKINANRIEVLRSFLGIEAQLDQAMGVKNRLALDKYRSDVARKQMSQMKLDEKRAAREFANTESSRINKKLAELQEEKKDLENIAEADRKPGQIERLAEIENQIPKLNRQKSQREKEAADLDEEIPPLTTEANATVADPNLTTPTLGQTGQLPTSDTYKAFIEKVISNLDKPNLSAEITLDNFIQMQYVIISKQLSLLRVEVGSDYRVIFLELPASIYTVDGKAHDYVAQIEWKAEAYYRNNNISSSPDNDAQSKAKTLKDVISPWHRRPVGRLITEAGVRALDIIPRQSALNVNQSHAVIKQTAILAGLKFIIGFAGKIDYQRQKELYEQFVQQDIFASGYGKGSNTFGWTFGPLPGTRRMAPGVRTTYAVLAVPQDALALELSATGRAYKKDKTPTEQPVISEENFSILIPNEHTEKFFVDSIAYTPVRKGSDITVLLKGRNFPTATQQLGVLINGTHLKPVISIARNASEEEIERNNGSEIKGEYEIVNSGTLILKFSMGDKYIGTPFITLVTPEKTSDINSFELRFKPENIPPTSLKHISSINPMFMDEFSFDEIRPPKVACHPRLPFCPTIATLMGKGFRPGAKIYINGQMRPSKQISTEEYEVTLPTPLPEKFKVTISQSTRQSFETKSREYDLGASQKPEIARYIPLPGNKAEVDLVLTLPGQPIATIEMTKPADGQIKCSGGNLSSSCTVPAQAGDKFRLTVEVNHDEERPPSGKGQARSFPRDTISLKVTPQTGSPKTLDISLPLRPSITAIESSSGHYNAEMDVVIKGVNLQQVAQVFFGDKKADILGQPARNALIVRAPKGAVVPAGEKARVAVRLETNVEVRGRKISNADDLISPKAYYSYLGDPLPKPDGKKSKQIAKR